MKDIATQHSRSPLCGLCISTVRYPKIVEMLTMVDENPSQRHVVAGFSVMRNHEGAIDRPSSIHNESSLLQLVYRHGSVRSAERDICFI